MSNIVITSNGRELDMEALKLKNEKTVALGNMKVNARGDELDPVNGEVSRTRTEKMRDYYKIHTPVPVKKSRPRTTPPPVQVAEPLTPVTPTTPVTPVTLATPVTTVTPTSTKESK